MSTHQPNQPVLELEVEVPGTPEEVWEAIATGPGISSWIHPTTVEEREGGTFTFDMGDGPRTGTVTAWQPPHRFAQETSWQADEASPATTLATEWIVATTSGGTCVVRMVTSGFGTGGDWADEFDGFRESMQTSLANLELYLTHFAGRSGTWIRAWGTAPGDRDEAWASLTGALGLVSTETGAHVSIEHPAIAGVVERSTGGRWRRDLLLHLDSPAAGLAALSLWGTAGMVALQAVLFGEDAHDIARQNEPAWRGWMEQHFPARADL
jgi:uncharacterized protein YndB with AHSA1/START domain